MKWLVLMLLVPAVVGCSSVSIRQDEVSEYHDTGTNAQELVLDRDLVIRSVELTMVADSWGGEKAKGVGSDVLVLMLDGENSSLLGCGIIYRDDVPVVRDEWVRCSLDRRVRLVKSKRYVMKVIEISPGGASGWNEYGFTKGDKYPPGMLLRDFNKRNEMDYAFRLVE